MYCRVQLDKPVAPLGPHVMVYLIRLQMRRPHIKRFEEEVAVAEMKEHGLTLREVTITQASRAVMSEITARVIMMRS